MRDRPIFSIRRAPAFAKATAWQASPAYGHFSVLKFFVFFAFFLFKKGSE
jgi:hypothetical protein